MERRIFFCLTLYHVRQSLKIVTIRTLPAKPKKKSSAMLASSYAHAAYRLFIDALRLQLGIFCFRKGRKRKGLHVMSIIRNHCKKSQESVYDVQIGVMKAVSRITGIRADFIRAGSEEPGTLKPQVAGAGKCARSSFGVTIRQIFIQQDRGYTAASGQLFLRRF